MSTPGPLPERREVAPRAGRRFGRLEMATGTALAIIAGGALVGWAELRYGAPLPPASHLPVVVYATPLLEPVLVRAEQRADPVKVAAVAAATEAAAARTAAREPDSPAKAVRRKVFERLAEKVPVQFTQYCLKGLTRRDNPVREGIVAADPRVFPLGRHVELFVGGKSLGRFLVDDTGGAVKGRIIDIWTPSCTDARRFGRRRGYAVLVPRDRATKKD